LNILYLHLPFKAILNIWSIIAFRRNVRVSQCISSNTCPSPSLVV
jgi:hypothetical protein